MPIRRGAISNPMKLQLGLKMVVLIGGRVGTVDKVTVSVGGVGNTVTAGIISGNCTPKS